MEILSNQIAGVTYPKRKLIQKDEKKIHYVFELEEGRYLDLSVTGVSEYRFLYANDEELIVRKGNSTLLFSADEGKSWDKEVELTGYHIYQIYKLSNGNYLVGTIDSENLSFIFLLNPDLTVLAKNQLGSMCWHSQNAIDENDAVLMFAEYQYSKTNPPPTSMSIFRSKDGGYNWEQVLTLPHPEGIRHWHTLQRDPYHQETWIATSGDTPKQSRWFIAKDNGDTWDEITDLSYRLDEFPNRSLSAHRTTTFCTTQTHYYYATDDLMGSAKEYFVTFKGCRKSSSKFYKASKSEPIKLEKLTNLGIHARSMIDIGEGYIFVTEAKYAAFNTQVFYVDKKRMNQVYFLFDIYASRRHSGSGSMNSNLLQNGTFYTYTANKTFQDSKSQTLQWRAKYIEDKNTVTNYQLEDFVRFDEHLWFLNSIKNVENIVFFNNHVVLELKKPEKTSVIYLMSGDEISNSLRPKKLFSIEHFIDDIAITLEVDTKNGASTSLFVQQYNDVEKVSSVSYPLKNGENQITFKRYKNANYLKLLFRISYEIEDSIELSNLTINGNKERKKITNSNSNKVNILNSNDKEIDPDNFTPVFDQYEHYFFKLDNLKVDILSFFKKNSDRLVVFYNGAVDVEKTPLPVFQRWSWLEKLPYSAMVISDPTIEQIAREKSGKSHIGWYQGDCDGFVLEQIVEHIKKTIHKLDIEESNVLFYGSSAGGFAALVSASLLQRSKACVINPQVDVLQYHKKHVDKLLAYLGTDKEETLKKKEHYLDAIKYFERNDNFPQVYYKQNELDQDHYIKHYNYFKDAYVKRGYEKRLHSVITSDERGHSAIPLYEEALEDIEKTFKIYSNRIDIGFFGFIKNESTLNEFKPRKDLPSYKLEFPLDWNIDPFNDRNWCFQLHAWRMIDNKLLEYEKSRGIKKIIDSLKIIADWENFTIKNENETFFTWYDMATGLRALKLAYMLNRIREDNLAEKIEEKQRYMLTNLAKIHIEKLKTQHISQNNHGVFQVHGLLMLSQHFSDIKSINYALNKMENLVKNQFYTDGFHTENSDEYHWFVFDIFEKYLSFDAYKKSQSIKETIKHAENIKKWTVFPNKKSLMTGDSSDTTRKVKFECTVEYKDDGTVFKFFKESGYVFVRSVFQTKAEEASMLFFQTAYRNNTHRHADDFNVLLYEYGLNILVDAGKYSYEYDTDQRKYVVSTRAHNTIMVDNMNYNLKECEFYESALKYCNEEKGIYTIKTSLHRKKLDVTHNRYIIYKPRYFLIVIDKLKSDRERKYDQFWHFHQDLEVVKSDRGFVTQINDKVAMQIEPYALKLGQSLERDDKVQNISLIKGQTEPELQGWRSLRYKELVENYALQNSIEANDALLVTKFLFCDKTNKTEPELHLNIEREGDNLSAQIVSSHYCVEMTVDI